MIQEFYYWVKDKFSQHSYSPYCPKKGPLYGIVVMVRPPVSSIVGEFALYRDHIEVFLDKTHKLYAQLISEREENHHGSAADLGANDQSVKNPG